MLFGFVAETVASSHASIITVESRPGIQQSYLFLARKNSPANVILFAGGHGRLQLRIDKGQPVLKWGNNNFLVRSRELFYQQGFNVAVIDGMPVISGR
jgi:hypothetical protein